MANQEREPSVLDFPNGQRVEDILKKAQNLANIQIIGAGLSLDGETGELSASGGGMPSDVKYATNLSLTIDSSTFVVTAQLLDQNGDNLGTTQTIDLPLESVVVGGSYNAQTKKVILTLKNGNTVEFSIADLVAGLQTELSASNKLNPVYINYDSTHRAVSDAEKTAWNTTTTNEVTDRAALAELIDGAAKNRLPITSVDSLKQLNTYGTWENNVYTHSSGVVFTVNDDMSITVNGTASGANAVLVLSMPGGFSIEAGNWILSGCPSGGSASTYNIAIAGTTSDTGTTGSFTSCSKVLVRIYVISGTTVDNLTFKPMVCSKAAWDISQAYQPYRPSYQELYERILALEGGGTASLSMARQ